MICIWEWIKMRMLPKAIGLESIRITKDRIRYAVKDKRSLDKKTYYHYKGVCVIYCGRIDIHRKVVYLYSHYIERVLSKDTNMGV